MHLHNVWIVDMLVVFVLDVLQVVACWIFGCLGLWTVEFSLSLSLYIYFPLSVYID